MFEGSTQPPPGGVVLDLSVGEDASGHLRGPVILGGPVVSDSSFPKACASKGCSHLSLWSQGPDTLQVQDLTLVTGPFVVSNQNGTQMPVDSLRISLFDEELAAPVYDLDGQLSGYELPAGSAHFLLAPAAAGVYSQLIATNTQPLILSETQKGWTASELELSYIDDSGNTWIVRVDPSSWRL